MGFAVWRFKILEKTEKTGGRPNFWPGAPPKQKIILIISSKTHQTQTRRMRCQNLGCPSGLSAICTVFLNDSDTSTSVCPLCAFHHGIDRFTDVFVGSLLETLLMHEGHIIPRPLDEFHAMAFEILRGDDISVELVARFRMSYRRCTQVYYDFTLLTPRPAGPPYIVYAAAPEVLLLPECNSDLSEITISGEVHSLLTSGLSRHAAISVDLEPCFHCASSKCHYQVMCKRCDALICAEIVRRFKKCSYCRTEF